MIANKNLADGSSAPFVQAVFVAEHWIYRNWIFRKRDQLNNGVGVLFAVPGRGVGFRHFR